MTLSRQAISDITGWLDLLEAKHPGPWTHIVDEPSKIVTIRDGRNHIITQQSVSEVTMLFAHLEPETLRELLGGYAMYRSSMVPRSRVQPMYAPYLDPVTGRDRAAY